MDINSANGQSDGRSGSKIEKGSLTASQYFEKVARDDLEQNKRLSASQRLNKNHSGNKVPIPKDDGVRATRMRFVVCVLGMTSLAMSQMSRMVMNQSITQMVDPGMHSTKSELSSESDGSCPWPEDSNTDPESTATTAKCFLEETATENAQSSPQYDQANTQSSGMIIATISIGAYGEVTQTIGSLDPTTLKTSTPSSKSGATEEFLTTTTSTAKPSVDGASNDNSEIEFANKQDNRASVISKPVAPNNTDSNLASEFPYPRYKWTIKQQSILLGGFYYSYFVFMVLGGRMAEAYGAKYVLLLSVAGSALINLATPWMASTSFSLLVASRVLMGIIQAGVLPSMYALFSKWLTITEASIFTPLIKLNLRLGMVLGSLIPGIVPDWTSVFYFTGFLSVVWSVFWFIIATSDPANNSWVSKEELLRITRKKRKFDKCKEVEMTEKGVSKCANVTMKKKKTTPWLKIITAPSVVGLIIVKLTINYGFDFLVILLPSYLKYVHHASRETISAISSVMFGIQVGLIIFVGWLAKVAIQKRPFNMSKTAVRQMFQGTASFGVAVTFFLFMLNNCNLTYVAILLQFTSFLSMFAAGGETMLPYDLSDEYPATIMAIANSIANLSGVTTTTIASIILGDQGGNFARWNFMIGMVACLNVFGGLCFTFLVKAEPIDFKSKKGEITDDLEAATEDRTQCRN